MKLLLLIACLWLITSRLYAQAYFSPIPVDNGTWKIPPQYAGVWKEEKYNNSGRSYSILIDPNETGHINIIQGFGAMVHGIISNIEGRLFLSLHEPGGREQPEGYYIYRMQVEEDKHIRLVPLKASLTVPAGQALAAFIAAQPDPVLLEKDKATWLTNTYNQLKKPLDTAGRAINITRKP